jgi:hypothetical protein
MRRSSGLARHASGDAASTASPLTSHPRPVGSGQRFLLLTGYGTGADQIRVPQLLLVSLGCGAVYSDAM